MALKDDVVAALDGVKSPDGTPLPKTGALSDIVVSDGKVFFSINVDAGAVNAWEPVRKHAEQAVRAVPGVQSPLTAPRAERKAATAPARPPQAAAHPGARAGARGETGQGVPGVESIIAVASGKGGVGKSTT